MTHKPYVSHCSEWHSPGCVANRGDRNLPKTIDFPCPAASRQNKKNPPMGIACNPRRMILLFSRVSSKSRTWTFESGKSPRSAVMCHIDMNGTILAVLPIGVVGIYQKHLISRVLILRNKITKIHRWETLLIVTERLRIRWGSLRISKL